MTKGPWAGRMFLAVPLVTEVREALTQHLADHLGSKGVPGRGVPPGNWHFTLKFLGDTSRSACAHLLEEVGRTDLGPPFEIGFGRLGAFPSARSARVLWLGVNSGTNELEELAGKVEEAAVRSGFDPERRRFSAHLTLSRLRHRLDVHDIVDGTPGFGARMSVAGVHLFRSHLSPSGARYEMLERFDLAPDDQSSV